MKNEKKQPKPTPVNKHVKLDAELIKNEEWLTTQQVLIHLKISRSTLYRMRKNQQIIGVKIGSSPMFPKSLINKTFLLRGLNNFYGDDSNTNN